MATLVVTCQRKSAASVRPGPPVPGDARRPSDPGGATVPHVVLLGDSIFDNAAYAAGGPAVIDHLAPSGAVPSVP